MNPPYGRQITKWVRKAFEEARTNAQLVVCLLPARTDTRWWHAYCLKGEILFIRGRLKFGDAKNSAPFPSVLVIFGPKLIEKRAGQVQKARPA
jgi:DNA N-6-adenine-methyltransferase Dam